MSGCASCGGTTELTDSDGGVKEGRFVEKYSCVSCDAWGTIKGNAEDPPHTWQKQGPLFNDY